MSKIALVLSSGGTRGFAHIGAIEALEENGIKPDIVLGTSIGAIIGGAYAVGYSVEEIKDIAFSLKKKHILDFSLRFWKYKGFVKGKKIDKLFKKFFADKKIENCPITFACVSNELVSGETVVFTQGELKRAIRASCSIPFIISPYQEDGKIYVDGAVTNRLAVSQAKMLGADIIIAVDVVGDISADVKLKSPIGVMFRSLDCIDNQVTAYKMQIEKPDILIKPELTIGQAEFKNLKDTYNSGYKATIECIHKIKEIIGEKV